MVCDLTILRKLVVIIVRWWQRRVKGHGQQSLLPIPEQLDIHNSAAAELWHNWRESRKHYSRATGLNEKDECVQFRPC